MSDCEIGQVVKSKAGRDKGKYFIIYDIKDEYVYLVDGDLRRIESPKRKKLKHIQPTKDIFEKIYNSIIKGNKLTNSDFQKALKPYYENEDPDKLIKEEV